MTHGCDFQMNPNYNRDYDREKGNAGSSGSRDRLRKRLGFQELANDVNESYVRLLNSFGLLCGNNY